MVFSQPFFRQRQAVQWVTPICFRHLERLTTAVVVGSALELIALIYEPQPFGFVRLFLFGSVAVNFPPGFVRQPWLQPGLALDFW